jgi:hypothetical protein
MGRGRDRTAAIKEAQHEADNRGSSRYFYVDTVKAERMGITRWKPENGPNFIRIISPKFDTYDKLPYFGRKVHVHTKVGADERTFLCLRKMYGEACPVCELYEELKAKNPNDEALKDLSPNLRYLFLVIDVTDTKTEKQGLRWFDAALVINDNIAELSQDRRGGGIIDPSDPDEGKDIEFVKVNRSPWYKGFRFHDNDPIPDEWLDDVPEDFEELLKRPTYDEVAKEVNGTSKRRSDEGRGERRSRSSDSGQGERRGRSRDTEDEGETVVNEEDAPRRGRRRDVSESSGRGRGNSEGPSDDVKSKVDSIVNGDD